MNDDAHRMPRLDRELRQILAGVSACFFCSGVTGLIYEVLWTRMLGLVFGHTVLAMTTVLAAFMAGLGLGSLLFGGLADRTRRPLALYGMLELGIGLYALLTPLLLGTAETIYIPVYRWLHLSEAAFGLARFTLTFLILLVPTTLMGATLPVMSRFFVHEVSGLGKQVSRLYALNTFGAVLGSYAAGFHLLPIFGVRTTLLLAAIANVGIGILAVVFDRHLRQIDPHASAPGGPQSPAASPTGSEGSLVSCPPGRPSHASASPVAVRLCVIGIGLSGAASMVYEVAWTRTLALVIGSSTYAFSTMLAAFLSGIALGSFLYSRWAKRLTVGPFFFGCLQLGIALGALTVVPFFDRMPELFLWAFRVSQSPGFVKLLQFGISAAVMLVPALFMGATFPCVTQIVSRALDRVGHDVGRIYFINTTGAIAGTILAGFVLIPAWGLQTTLKLAVLLNLVLALALFIAAGKGLWQRVLAPTAAVGALVLLLLAPSWDAGAMSSGVAVYGRNYFGMLGKVDFRRVVASAASLVYYRDGISSTVSVHRQGNNLYMRVNGKTDAGNRSDMHTQLMSGHLPLLLHPSPKQVLVIGLGSGVTAGAVAAHPVTRLDLVEIEPAVVDASAFFAKENRQVLRDPRARMIVADGRNFLLAADTRYDVVVTEPSNPWMRGIGNLFSLEFYTLVANRLAPRGIICQWIHAYGLFPEDLRMVVRTVRAIFPHTTIWNTTPGDFLLIGSKEPIAVNMTQWQARYDALPALRADMASLGLRSPLALLADFVLTDDDAARYGSDGWLNTDDLPLLEFSAPDSLYADTVGLNRRLMQEFRKQEFPPIQGLREGALQAHAFRVDLGVALLAKGLPDEALPQFEAALQSDPRDAEALLQRGRILAGRGAVFRAEADFQAAAADRPDLHDASLELARLYLGQRVWDRAETTLRRLRATAPRDPAVLAMLADLLRERQRVDEAIALSRLATDLTPQDPALWTGLGLAYQAAGRFEEALLAFHQARAADQENDLVDLLLGRTYLALKRFPEAEAAFVSAAGRGPTKLEPHLELGRLYLERGDKAKALASYRQALRLDPLNLTALRAVEDLAMALEPS